MNWNLIKGYVLATAAVLILAAAAFIVLNNIGGQWTLQVIWRPATMRPAAWLLAIGVSGAIVWWTIYRLAPLAVRTLKEGTKLRKSRQHSQAIKDFQKDRAQKAKPGE